MLRAANLRDRINQEKYNDCEALVGLVFRSVDSGTGAIVASTPFEMSTAAGLATNVVPQVIGFRYVGDIASLGWYTELENMFTGSGLDTTILFDIFQNWGADQRQYVQIRSVSVDIAPDSTTSLPRVYMKVVADAYTAD